MKKNLTLIVLVLIFSVGFAAPLLAMNLPKGCFCTCCCGEQSDSENLVTVRKSSFSSFYIITATEEYISYAEVHEILTKINKLYRVSKDALADFAILCGRYSSYINMLDEETIELLYKEGFVDASGNIVNQKIAAIVKAAVRITYERIPNCLVDILTEEMLYMHFKNKESLIHEDKIFGVE